MASPEVCQKRKAMKSLASCGSSDPFIVATGEDSIKPDASSRRFIRRHVMRGKNRKRIAPRALAHGSWINRHNQNPSQWAALSNMESLHGPFATPVVLQMNSTTPSLLGFVDMEPCMLHLIYNFITIMGKAMYPVEFCVDFKNEDHNWFRDLSHDPAYAHSVLSTAQAYFDLASSQTFGPTAIVHMNKTMFLLRNKLAEADLVITDATIFTVLALVLFSKALDDHAAAQKHLYGLHELVKIRGGIVSLSHKPLLQMKCCRSVPTRKTVLSPRLTAMPNYRVDLSLALKTGSPPLFFTDHSICWKPYLYDSQRTSKMTPLHTVCDLPDIRLVNVWLDLHELTTAINLSHQTKCKLSAGLFQEALISVQYRLQNLIYNIDDAQEIMRVAMLAISTTLFIDTRDISTKYRLLSEKLRVALQSLEQNANGKWLQLTLWLIFIGKLLVLDGPEDGLWLGEKLLSTIRSLEVTSWAEVRHILKGFLWIDGIYDKAGKSFLEDMKGH
ncbi:hypothetical protein PVAR5_0887 [Paecilomyces variotii No. 5]|uniref:Uncharacterized protein n=1 Tax=Byssochlamys spectabilis (strain No. 5 / NBRC 109023) TaxID=1356009 RepID=V5FUK8_BYSSN|nr:hypothetical protein PVAR5_0887 [Paecilomyces variotii No. 5]